MAAFDVVWLDVRRGGWSGVVVDVRFDVVHKSEFAGSSFLRFVDVFYIHAAFVFGTVAAGNAEECFVISAAWLAVQSDLPQQLIKFGDSVQRYAARWDLV